VNADKIIRLLIFDISEISWRVAMQTQKARILFNAAVAHVLAVSLFMCMRRNLKGQAAVSVSLLL